MADRPDGFWGVRDSNARNIDEKGSPLPRRHEVRLGKSYELWLEQETYMPEADARVFLKDAAFIVTDQNGDQVASLSKDALRRTSPNELLPPNMVVASLEELTATALYTRVAQRPRSQGKNFSADSSRDAMIRFLEDEFRRDAEGSAPADFDDVGAGTAGGALEVEDMPEDGATAARVISGDRLLEGH